MSMHDTLLQINAIDDLCRNLFQAFAERHEGAVTVFARGPKPLIRASLSFLIAGAPIQSPRYFEAKAAPSWPFCKRRYDRRRGKKDEARPVENHVRPPVCLLRPLKRRGSAQKTP